MNDDYFDDIFESDCDCDTADIVPGEDLPGFFAQLPRLRREAFPHLRAHVSAPPSGRIMVLAGVPSTGKTTLLLQAAAALPPALLKTAAFVRRGYALDCDDISSLADSGMTHVFIDDVTDEAEGPDLSMLSSLAGKMVLTLASRDTLFFRSVKEPGLEVLRVSHVPARERMRLTDTEFPRCVLEGGMLDEGYEGPSDYWKPRSTLNGLARLGRGWERELRASSDDDSHIADTLRSICRMPAVEAFRRIFPHEREEYRKILERAERGFAGKEGIMRSHLRCLELEDILASCPEEDTEGRIGVRRLAVQPYYRFRWLEEFVGNAIEEEFQGRILEALKGDLLLDTALLDLMHAASDKVRTAALLLPGRHRGMLVSDMRRRRCALFIATTLREPNAVAARPLREPAAIAGITRRHGAVVRQVELYGGETRELDGVLWQNAEEFLKLLDNPAYLDWVCRFDRERAPAAPVNWSARRFRLPARPSNAPGRRQRERPSDTPPISKENMPSPARGDKNSDHPRGRSAA